MIRLVNYSFRNYKRYFIYIILFLIIILLCFIFCSSKNYYSWYINNILGSKKVNRELVLYDCEDAALKRLINNKNIVDYHPLYKNIYALDDDLRNVSINIYYDYKIIEGRKIKANDEIVISRYYYNILELSDNDIGVKMIRININNQKFDFRVVGVTEKNDINIYLKEELFDSIYVDKIDQYYFLVNSYSETKNILDDMSNHGFNIELKSDDGLDEISNVINIINIFNYFIYFMYAIIAIIIYYMIKNIVNDDKKNISIYISIGFNIKKIIIILFLRLIILLSITFMIAFCMIIIVWLIKISNNFLDFININLLFKCLMYEILYFIFVIIINLLYCYFKIKKIDIINELQMN